VAKTNAIYGCRIAGRHIAVRGFGRSDVCFESKADICAATSDVRFTPNSDRESEIPHKVISALPPKVDMCSALVHVCFGPEADMHGATSDVR
jgi:hypothetical protein